MLSLSHVPLAYCIIINHKFAFCWLSRLVPAGFAFAAIAALTIAPLPDAALRLNPVDLPSDWQSVAAMIPKDQGAVALWPAGMAREYSFAPTQSLDPARRLLRAPVLEDGELEIDGKPVDADRELLAVEAAP